jgi:NAD dependent epimerase/dehydratase family enzyme
MKTILVAGASGLVGKNTVNLLKRHGYTVHTLSNSRSTDVVKHRFHWSPDTGKIDIRCFDGVDHVINLSGAGLFEHRWTASYKKKIVQSRVLSTALLAKTIVKHHYLIESFINASATGIYRRNMGR